MDQRRVINDIQEDEIDLRELIKTILKYKKFIVIFTLVVVLVASLYIFLKPIIYQGNMLIEIGQALSFDKESKTIDKFNLENNYDLQNILSSKFIASITVPRQTKNLLSIQCNSPEKKIVEVELSEIFAFIQEREREKLKLYSLQNLNISHTKIISQSISISQTKKVLIIAVSFVTGFIFSIFLVFLMEFIKGMKEEK